MCSVCKVLGGGNCQAGRFRCALQLQRVEPPQSWLSRGIHRTSSSRLPGEVFLLLIAGASFGFTIPQPSKVSREQRGQGAIGGPTCSEPLDSFRSRFLVFFLRRSFVFYLIAANSLITGPPKPFSITTIAPKKLRRNIDTTMSRSIPYAGYRICLW
jgi:hypothetical protein